jgi:hypothetical protein
MAVSFIDRIKGFLLAPGETFRKIKDEEPAAVYKYLAAIVVIEAVLLALVSVVFLYNHPIKGIIESSGVADVASFGLFLVIAFFVLFIGSIVFALWTHIWVYVMGGRKGVMTTVKAILYSLTPFMLIGWIPVVGWIIGTVWSIVLGVIGIRELHVISTGRAAGAIILSFVIAFFILLIFGLLSMGIIVNGLTSAPG